MTDGELLGAGQPDPHAGESELWARAARQVETTPFEAKALYVAGLMRHLVEGAGRCLTRPSFDLPAYVLCAEAVEVLGRCLTGSRKTPGEVTKRLKAGFAAVLPAEGIRTRHREDPYTVSDCISFRNFAAHGGSTPEENDVLDPDLLVQLLRRLADRIDRYWEQDLKTSGEERAGLAHAGIRPLRANGSVIFVDDMYRHIAECGRRPGHDLMYQDAWRTSRQ